MKSQRSIARKAKKKNERRKKFERAKNVLHSKPEMKGYRVVGPTEQKRAREKLAKQKELATNALGSHSATGNDK